MKTSKSDTSPPIQYVLRLKGQLYLLPIDYITFSFIGFHGGNDSYMAMAPLSVIGIWRPFKIRFFFTKFTENHIPYGLEFVRVLIMVINGVLCNIR